ncbi:MAG TPA: bifunctional phosphopantothenoylcysteine decarboxylase/phosphopantothenate--cysteine ligase CoaBC [Ktedonobacterales bacterium]|jgi:phosphopantothenoylcysteine decarboxylase/phosphopantothenate--cysteine ligase|nr:bifunctional phosphopantothenoylcysteine decarboxylase/phosphopantothenate--cysteine ligase CoaBC [Ktedonobacterales bacterium]
MLRDRRIVMGVCGGIAAYKAADVVSKLQQAGALVDVILTHHAGDFVRALTFSTLSHRPVYEDLWESSGQAAARHIELAEAAEVLLVAPATADTIARLAHGMASDMLGAVALATTAPLVVVPAMEQHMYEHAATQANLRVLVERGATIVPPEVGHLASGMIGTGRFPETPTILAWVRAVLGRDGDLAGRRVVVTAGGTQEPIDPVRYVGNRSSGLMGYALAEEARDRGAEVVLISGPVALPPPAGLRVERVLTALEMRDAVVAAIAGADALVMAAAVADYRVEHPATHKIKKGSAAENRDGSLALRLVRNPDILADVRQRSSGTGLIRVGFAAETDDLAMHAAAKLNGKGLHLLVANDISKVGSGFGTATNEVAIFHPDGRIEQLALLPKHDVAAAIWDRVVPLLRSQTAPVT